MNALVSALKTNLPLECWSDDTDVLAPHLSEWRGRWHGETPMIVMPASTDEAARAINICREYGGKITPQGGNTGLVGGQIPQGEILLSSKRLTNIHSVNTADLSLVCGAGVTVLAAQNAASAAGLKYPLSLASEGSCTIGGTLSTNAGGINVLKYGPARGLCFGVEAVLANGTVFSDLSPLYKDNTGYDLSQLLIGAEGTLGFITAAALHLSPRPDSCVRIMAACRSPDQAQHLLAHCRIDNHLSMFELIPRIGIELVCKNSAGMRDPFASAHPWYVLLEWEFGEAASANGFAERHIGAAAERGYCIDAVIAQNERQSAQLLTLRENMSAAQKPEGATIKHDVTVPISRVAEFIARANALMAKHCPGARPCPFGHFGDGNIHYNIVQPPGDQPAEFMAREPEITDIVYSLVSEMGGSISAEHGIGILKKPALAARASGAKLEMLGAVKRALDPDNLFNPRVLI